MFGEEVGTDGGLVLACEFLGVISVHEGCFPNSENIYSGMVIECVQNLLIFVA